MSALTEALIADLASATDDQRAQLADLLRPFLATQQPAPSGSAGWIRGAKEIAKHIGAPESRVYALSSAGRIPVERDGSALIARKADLDAWVLAGGAKRP